MKLMQHLFIASALLFVAGCGGQTSPPAQVGDPAPRFNLTEVGAQEMFDSDRLKGDVVVLSFWSTSCAECLREIDQLKEIQSGGQVKVVGIAIDGEVERVKKIIETKAINYPVLQGDESVFVQYDGYSVPYTLVLDRSSILRKRTFGPFEPEELRRFSSSLVESEVK